MMRSSRLVFLLAGLLLVASPAIGEDTPVAASPTSETVTEPETLQGAIDGMVDIGGRELYLRCSGEGQPTVVYMHGYSYFPGGGAANAGQIPYLLDDTTRVCVYDRANVGLSDTVDTHQSGADSVADLHALLDVAGIDPPYVLLGASFGGMLAYLYAGAAAEATLPEIPVTLIGLSEPEPVEGVPYEGRLAYRDLQIDLVEPFDPGLVVLAATPHLWNR